MVTKKNSSNEQSTVKVRIIDFEMSGSDQSLQESLQTIAAAFSRGSQTVQVSRNMPNRAAQILDAATETESLDSENDETEDVSIQNFSERKTNSAPRKPAKPPVLKILNDISFTAANPTLKTFYEQKKPGKVNASNYLVIAYWFKHHGGIEQLTVDHFHTAFRHLSVPTPKNALQPLRDLKNNRDGRMMNGSAPGTSIINHLGENFVDAMNKA